MTEKNFQTRILNKIDTLERWNASSLKIKKGEICIATIAAEAGTGLTEPVVMVKIGTEDGKTFSELPWALHAKASDVISACKSTAGLTSFVDNVITEKKLATARSVTELAGKVTAVENELNTEETGIKARLTSAETAIEALEGLVGGEKLEEVISAAIEAAIAAERDVREAEELKLSNRIKTVEDDYLKAADKTELAEDIQEVTDAIDALEFLVGTDSVAKQIEDAVKVETDRATGIEGGLRTDIDNVKADYLKASDKAELQGNIDVVSGAVERLTNGVSAEEIDGVNDLIEYVNEHGTEVTGMQEDIAENTRLIGVNAQAIADHAALDHDFAAADTALENKLNAEIAKKADAATVSGIDERLATAEGEIETLQTNLGTAEGKITALEEKVGEKTVAEQIDEAIEAENLAQYAKASDLTDATERITTAEGKITDLETEATKKANDADLHAIAKSGSISDLDTTGFVLVFNCGDSTEQE